MIRARVLSQKKSGTNIPRRARARWQRGCFRRLAIASSSTTAAIGPVKFGGNLGRLSEVEVVLACSGCAAS